MKRITLQFSSLLAALFLFAFSCQDHRDPDPEPIAEDARVRTLEITNPGQVINDLNFRMSFEKLGTRPIAEFGVLLSFQSSGSDEFSAVPTFLNQFTSALKFEKTPTQGEHQLLRKAVGFDDFEKLYYRAYARLSNGTVVYGDVLEFRPIVIPVFDQLVLTKNENGVVTAKLDVKSLGSSSIAEYGVAYSYRTSPNGTINSEPTVEDKKALYTGTFSVSAHFVNLPVEGGSLDKIYARPYLKYPNGDLYYGSVKSL